MNNLILKDHTYIDLLSAIKQKIHASQIKAALTVNQELLSLYWELGAIIVEKQAETKWGDGFIRQLSNDLSTEFPDMKGFSKRNLELIRQWHLFYVSCDKGSIAKQVVAQITRIPWGHNIVIITKCKSIEEAFYYIQNAIEYGWSRSVLIHQIESGLYHREGKAVTNFNQTMPKPQSDLAIQAMKDPYIFDFLRLSKDYTERDIENALVAHITKFLLELGAGFAYVGRQIPLEIDGREFFIDLLFYHLKLRSYVVIELKAVEFEPEHAGKLNFYLKAVDSILKHHHDQPSIGLIICKKKSRIIAEYALSDINKPIGISEYRLTQSIPENLKSSLPSIEEIEAELEKMEAGK